MRPAISRESLRKILHTHWGYPTFRLNQEDIIASVVEGYDTLGLLPTGGGKSITYQVAGLARGGLTLVVTPLIALMDDQVQNLKRRGLRALVVHSGLDSQECLQRLENALYGEYSFLYLSPERLQTEAFLARIEELDIRLIAVDEAHCISQWGQDFRRAYREIARIREYLPNVPVLAVTATATPAVIADIQTQLGFCSPRFYSSTFSRPGLQYHAAEVVDGLGAVYEQVCAAAGAAIVYVPHRADVHVVEAFLNARGERAVPYHGGMNAKTRAENQQAWMGGQARIIVATNAFGMGIDKENVRLVAHWGLPPSPEAYYQEAGRAGRDGQGGKAVLFYSSEDFQRLRFNLASKYPPQERVQRFVRDLFAYLRLAPGDDTSRPLDFDITAFSHAKGYRPVEAYGYLALLEREQWLTYRQAEGQRLFIRLETSPARLQDYAEGIPHMEELLRYLLSRYPQCVHSEEQIHLQHLLQGVRLPFQALAALLNKAEGRGWLSSRISSSPQLIQLVSPECPSLPIGLDWRGLQTRVVEDTHRMQTMIAYATEPRQCREKLLREYFGETNVLPCGRCDHCLGIAL